MSMIPFLTANVAIRQNHNASLADTFRSKKSELAETERDASENDYLPNDPDMWLYRDRTVALLRRYFRISIEVGRLPSLVGRELFRSKVTAYRMRTFEDAVIFVHDIEHGLQQLGKFEQELIAKIVFQEYTQDEAARLMGCWRRTVGRRFTETLDRLSEIFLAGGVLSRFPSAPKKPPQSCQEAEFSETFVSGSEHGK